MARQPNDNHDEWAQKRQFIIETAAELFAERGVDAVSLRDIAKASGLHMSTLYYYFPGKSDMYRAACHWGFQRISTATSNAIRQEGTFEDKLKGLVSSIIRFLMEDHIAARLLDQEFILKPQLSGLSDFPPMTRRPNEELVQLLEQSDRKILGGIETHRLAEITWDVIYGVARFSALHARVTGVSPAADMDRMTSEAWIILNRILFGAEAPE